MIDIKLTRIGSSGFPDVIRGSQYRRCADKSIVDQLIVLDNNWKRSKFEIEKVKRLINIISKKIGVRKNMKKKNLIFRINFSKKKLYLIEKKIFTFEESKDQSLSLIGNLIHNSSIFSKKETECKSFCLRKNLNYRVGPFLVNHVDILEKIDGVEYRRGIYISGNRGYFLKKFGFLLNIGLIQYGLDFLQSKEFIPIQTPYFMKKSIMTKCAQLDDFKEQLYCLKEETDKFLIATSEQPISALHCNEKIVNKNLPIKYAGFSTCFRKESGSHGKDTSGIFRVHQFEKIEQFIISDHIEHNSWILFEELLENAKTFYSSLEIPFQLINISSGALNSAASKKVDLLGWFPVSKAYRELVSCSNCTNFQSRGLNISTGVKNDNNRGNFVYMLNSTLCATTRVICCILENYQNDRGIIVPDVLRNYLGISFIPFEHLNTLNKIKKTI
jgi:seryl-tRNA synthetase